MLVMTNIGEEGLQRISSVSPRVKITDASELFPAERKGDLAAKEKLTALLGEAEVVFGRFELSQDVLPRAPELKWVQTMGAGVNRYLTPEMMVSPVIMTNSSGIHAIQIGEFIISRMLMFAKQSPLLFRLQQERKWGRVRGAVLRSKTVGIVGLGHIGREAARLSKAFGMKVLATRRSAKRAGRGRYVDIIFPPSQLKQLLAESDFVALSVPLTRETNKLIGKEELRAMKPTAYLINIARGSVIDEEVLVRALEENWIAGAALDVFTTEPLPADNRLWGLPNVIISPHSSGGVEGESMRATELFCENLKRYLAGKKLFNVVDKERGY